MHLHKKYPQYQPEQQQQQQQNEQYQQQIQPNQAEVDGQKIKLSGLDYSLLQKQKQRERRQKSSWMTKISQRVKTLQLQSQSQSNSLPQPSNPSLPLTGKKIPQNYKSLESYLKNSSISASSSTSAWGPTPKFQSYLQFNLTQFDRPVPSLIMKRIGKAADRSVFVHFQEGFFREWRDIAARERVRENGKKMDEKEENGNQIIAEDSQDDIFGNDSDQNENNAPIKNQKNQLNIQIGKKLDFGLSTQQIFSQKRPTPTPSPSQPTAQDKYFFMPKPKKMTPSIQAQLDDGYDQCYHQSGPSLQELVSLKKQGIQYYGDLKEREKKERKGPNVHKEYEMVKKIMERNQKNGK